MNTTEILRLLIAERDRLDVAINALQPQGQKRGPGRPPKSAAAPAEPGVEAPKRVRTAAQKKAQAEKMRAYWAAKRKAKG